MTLIAPFIKVGALSKLLDNLRKGTSLWVLTRWEIPDLVANVSDLDVWQVIEEHKGEMRLLPRLHAKIFQSEATTLVGSANITSNGLGWSTFPNWELLVHPSEDELEFIQEQIELLWDSATIVDETMYRRFKQILPELPQHTPNEASAASSLLEDPGGDSSMWSPASRDPGDVVRLYVQGVGAVTSTARQNAQLDLLNMATPADLSQDLLKAHIYLFLLQHPVPTRFRTFLSTPRRFGEVVGAIEEMYGVERTEATEIWQNWIRWLLYFQPDIWKYERPRYSEVLMAR